MKREPIRMDKAPAAARGGRRRAGPGRMGNELRIQSEIVRHMAEGACLVRASDALIVYANPRFEKMFGYEAGESEGLPIARLHYGTLDKSAGEVVREILGALEKNGGATYEALNVRKDGTLFWCRTRANRLDDPELGPVWVALYEDITERRRIEAEVREANRALERLIASSPLAIIALDREGRVQLWNSSASSVFGWSKPEVLGKPVPIVPPEKSREFRRLLAGFAKGKHASGLELRRRRKDGSPIDVQLWSAPVRNERGEWIGTFGMFVDVTERKRSEELFRAQHGLFRAVTEVRDLSATLRLCLEAALRVSGMECGGLYLVDESGGLRLAQSIGLSDAFVAAAGRYAWGEPHARLAKSGEPIYARHDELDLPLTEAERREGLEAFAHLPIRNEHRLIGCLNVASRTMREVPSPSRVSLETIASGAGLLISRAQADEALRALTVELTRVEERERQALAVALHDEVGQTLAVARMKLALLAGKIGDGGVGEEIERTRELLHRAIESAQNLTFDLFPPVLEELGLDAAIEWAGERICEEHGLDFVFGDDGSEKPLGTGARAFLFRAARELMTNAARHASASRLCASVERRGRTVRVVVEDDGKGFRDETAGRLPTGGGFGLFSIRQRAAVLGGSFAVEEPPLGGTRAVLSLPIDEDGGAR